MTVRHCFLIFTLVLASLSSAATATQRLGEDFGSYVVYATAVLTKTLAPQVARHYGITRSNQRCLLTIAVEKKATDRPFPAVAAEIDVRATNLAGPVKAVDLREVESGDEYVYYIGTFSVAPSETILFELQISPEGTEETLNLEFERRFVSVRSPGD